MRSPTYRQSLAALAGLILAGAAAFAASPSAAAPSAAAPSAAFTTARAASAAASAPRPASAASRPAATSAAAAASRIATRCHGAVTHTLNASKALRDRPQVCLTVGGIVRFEKLGPGELTIAPDWAADCFYAAGVHMCRLLHARLVTFTWSIGDARQTLPVRVVDALPTPACEDGGQTVSVDTTEELPWWSPCVHVGARIQVTNVGPDALQVSPRAAVTCRYEAAVHDCVTLAATTLEVIANPGPRARSLSVVVLP